MAKKKRSAAQIAATKRMIAANKAKRRGAAPAVSRAKPKRKSSPAKKSAAPKRKKRSWQITGAAEASYAGRKLRYRRRNPIGGGFIGDTLIPSAAGAAGAVALDVLLGVLPLPASLKTGPMAPVVKIAGALGLGAAAGMVVNKRMANQIAACAVTVAMYQVAKTMLAKVTGGRVPGLSAYVAPDGRIYPDQAYVNVPAIGEYVGEYMSGDEGVGDDMGYPSPGMIVGDLMPDGSVEGYETGVYR